MFKQSQLEVFVSYIRRYVLTKDGVEPSFKNMCKVFVSYIRRYVLTDKTNISISMLAMMFSSPIFGDMFLLKICPIIYQGVKRFSSPIFGDMFLLQMKKQSTLSSFQFSSPIFGDMFLLFEKRSISVNSRYSFRLLYSEICSYQQWKTQSMQNVVCCFRLLYSEICY